MDRPSASTTDLDLITTTVPVNNDQCRGYRYKTREGKTYTIKTACPSQGLSCSICLMLANDPVFPCESQHLYCRSCISKTTQKKCPECRVSYTHLKSAPSVKRIIENQLFHCPFKDCSFIGDKTIIESHVEKESEKKRLKDMYENYLELGSSYTFSPELSKKQLKQQLSQLQTVNAHIGEQLIPLRSFKHIEICDISELESRSTDKKLNFMEPDVLVILVGKTRRTLHLPLYHCTFIGGTACISYEKDGQTTSFNLQLGETKIKAQPGLEKRAFFNDSCKERKRDDWLIREYKTDLVDINPKKHMSMPIYPLVHLKNCNLLYVTLNCDGKSEGIIASDSKSVMLAHVKIHEAKGCGAYFHDCDIVHTQSNTIKTSGRFRSGFTFFNCNNITNVNNTW